MFQDSVPAGSYNDPFLSSVWGGGQGDANVGASWSTNSVTIFSGASGQQVTCIQLLATNN